MKGWLIIRKDIVLKIHCIEKRRRRMLRKLNNEELERICQIYRDNRINVKIAKLDNKGLNGFSCKKILLDGE